MGRLSLTPNLVLLAEFYDAHIFTPSSGYMTWMKRFNFLGTGPGLKYYLTSDNVYLTGSVMLSRITFESGSYYDYWSSPDQSSHWGVVDFTLMVVGPGLRDPLIGIKEFQTLEQKPVARKLGGQMRPLGAQATPPAS